MHKNLLLGPLVAALLSTGPAFAQHAMQHGAMAAPTATAPAVHFGDLEISGAFTRATLPNAPVGGGYLTIVNSGSTDQRLVAARSPVAGEVQLHEMKLEGDMMKMRQLEGGIAIPAGATVTLAPGGLHLMLMGLNQTLAEGSQVPVTLVFEPAGEVEIALAVGSLAAGAAGH